jgi:hypothetical protein
MRRATIGSFAITAVAVGCLVGCIPLTPPSPSPGPPLGVLPASAPPTSPVKERTTVTWVQVNFCNGESVQLNGELREDTKVKDARAEQRIKAHLTGVGDFGNEYKLDLDVASKWDTASMTMTLKDRYVLASKGPSPDQRVTVRIGSSPLSIDLKAECR